VLANIKSTRVLLIQKITSGHSNLENMAPYIMGGVALITGAASGIGRACAVAFAEEGVTRLILADMNTAGLEETSNILKQLNHEIETVVVQTDTSSPNDVQNMVDLGVERFGSIHYAVNSAGVSTDSRAKSADLAIDAWDRVVNINLRGVWLCQRAVIQQMLKQDYLNPEQMKTRSPPERGCIVNISSVVGRAGLAATGGVSIKCCSRQV
jgi:NAD(P)-dependent dehydrogenase (short-subunit alcohol dehydrogenase family)